MKTTKITMIDTATTRWVALREPAYKGGQLYAYLEMFVGPQGKIYSIYSIFQSVPDASRIVQISDAYL